MIPMFGDLREARFLIHSNCGFLIFCRLQKYLIVAFIFAILQSPLEKRLPKPDPPVVGMQNKPSDLRLLSGLADDRNRANDLSVQFSKPNPVLIRIVPGEKFIKRLADVAFKYMIIATFLGVYGTMQAD